MGHVRHKATVVTSWNADLANLAHIKALGFWKSISPMMESEINGYHSFVIPTSGSKAGWDEENADTACRAEFMTWCRAQAHSDGSNSLQVIEVEYGEDEAASILHEIGHPSINH